MLKRIRKLLAISLIAMLMLTIMPLTTAYTAANEAEIVTFGIPGQSSAANINNTTNAVLVIMPTGTDLSALTPVITVSEGASISPPQGTPRDFSIDGTATYTITAADSTFKTYTVTVLAVGVPQNISKDILSFEVAGQVPGRTIINNTDNTITVLMPYGTASLNGLSTQITLESTNTAVSPASGVPQNFSSPVQYIVSAPDYTTKTYTVTVSIDDPPASSAKDITLFTIPNQIPGSTVINNTANTITLTMPQGISLTSLSPSITVSENASVSPASGSAQDFSSPRTYTVTAQDGTSRQYEVTVTSSTASNEKDIIAFTIPGQVENSTVINNVANTITLTMPFGANLAGRAPIISVSANATVSPLSGVVQNFTTPRTYTVTAQDGTTKQYEVTVENAAGGSAKDITWFVIAGQIGETAISGTDISITMPAGTNLISLIPTITHTGASISHASGAPRNFTEPAIYTVTAQDGSTKEYTVTVTTAVSSAKDITTFIISGQQGGSSIGLSNIFITMPPGTDLTSLAPTITHSGASINPASGTERDFSTPQTYTVTALDGTTKQYTVTVMTAPPSTGKDITGFSVVGQMGSSIINADTIIITLPDSINLANLTPSIQVSAGASVNPASGTARDFTSPVTYTVTAQDGSTKQYIVTALTASANAKDITQFTVAGQTGNTSIGVSAITLSMPYGTSLASLAPSITVSPNATVSPASGVARNFNTPQTYTVTAMDGTVKHYTVTVNIASRSNDKDITSFSIPGQVGSAVIGTNTITVTMPFGTNVTWLRPTIEVSTGARISPTSGEARNFTNIVSYTVTAENGTTKMYTVLVNFSHDAVRDEKDILHFYIPGQIGASVIGTNTITVTMPHNTNVTWLIPDIVASQSAWVSPNSGVARNFTNIVTYTVTAQNGTTKNYSVNVRFGEDERSARDITSFSIPGQIGVASIGTNSITVTMPGGTDVTALHPVLTVSTNARVSPASGVPVNFTSPATYTVTAENGMTKTYTVTVNFGTSSSSGRDITAFTIPGQVGNSVIGTDTISLTMPRGTNLTNLTPSISVSAGARVNPVSGSTRNFTNPVQYTVTAGDGSTKNYTVTVNVQNEQPLSTTITIPLVNGSVPANSVANPDNAMRGTTVYLPPITARAGFTFSNWVLRSGDTTIINPSSSSGAYFTMGSQNVAIDAIFAVQGMTFANLTLPDGLTGIAYRATVTPPDNGSGRYTYSASPPAGLAMSRDGIITGIPNMTVNAQTFTVTANDTVSGISSQAVYTISIITAPPGATATLPFSDTPMDAWFYGAVLHAYNNGYMDSSNQSHTMFSPNVPLTRSMIVTALYRHAGSPDTSGLHNPFSDVGHTHYTEAVLWAAENNIVGGYDNRYSPEDNITRQDLAAIFHRYAQFNNKGAFDASVGLDYFEDADSISDYATDAAAFCFDKGIIIGSPGNMFAPRENATRAEFATMLMRFLAI